MHPAAKIAVGYGVIAVLTFGWVSSSVTECDVKARDVAKCKAVESVATAIAWPLFASYATFAALRP